MRWEIRTDRPLKRRHEAGHDCSLEDCQSDLGEHFPCEDLERATRFSDHVRFPEDTEHVPDYRV